MPKASKKPLKKKSKETGEEEVEVYPEEEQGILPKETPDERKLKMKLGEEDEDIYSEEGQEEEVEEDEIEPWEEGFMQGAAGPGQLGKDALTGKPLVGSKVVEAVIEGKLYRFADEENVKKFKEKKAKEKKKWK